MKAHTTHSDTETDTSQQSFMKEKPSATTNQPTQPNLPTQLQLHIHLYLPTHNHPTHELLCTSEDI